MLRRQQILLRMLICTLAVPLAMLAAGSQTGSQYSPTFPLGLIPIWICSARKRKPIGGWLMFYYWQLYSGLLITAVFFAMNIQSYVPENVESTRTFSLFLASIVPVQLSLVAECAVATLLLSTRTWDMFKLLRWVMVAGVAAAVLGTGIDAIYFPDNLPLSLLATASDLLWLAYVFRSKRVRHVFCLHDWDSAVNSIHPLKLKMGILEDRSGKPST